MFDSTPYKSELTRRMDVVRKLLIASHPTIPPPTALDIGREVRGLSIVLMFAAYEHLLTSVCRGLLETAVSLKVGNKSLRKGFKLFTVHGHLQSLHEVSIRNIWKPKGLKIIETIELSRKCNINVNLFPSDGSFMKQTQVTLLCELFELGDPAAVLKEAWSKIDGIVTARNGIAHGRLTPEEVGRGYSHTELVTLLGIWETRWSEFLTHVETRASSRDFFRVKR